MTMKQLMHSLFLGFSSLLPLLPLSVTAASDLYHPVDIPQAGEICIERFEDDGLQNIVPVNVLLRGTAPASAPQLIFNFLGGQAACWWASAPLVGSLRLRWVFRFDPPGYVGPETFSSPVGFKLAPNQI